MQPRYSLKRSRRHVVRSAGFALLALLVCGGLGSAAPAFAERSAPKYPNSIVVLGHSGATGYNSTAPLPKSWGFDQKTAVWNRNVWATGDNPKVQSIYSRILARNPAIKGHNFNVAKPYNGVTGLLRQAQRAILLKPTPELVVLHGLDNDIACDGTDPSRYKAFGAAFAQVLGVLAKGAPKARILVVSQWSLDRQHIDVIEQMTTAAERGATSDDGPCDAFDKSGALVPARVAYLEKVIDGYEAQVAAKCARVSNCLYDRGALRRMVVVPADLTRDLEHLSVQGQRKAAAIAWSVLY